MTTNNVANFGTGASGTLLTGNGVGSAPTFQAPAANGTGRLLSFQVLTSGSAATYTKNASATNILVEMVGGGGGGGSGTGSGTTLTGSGGGGAGGYCRKWITSAASTYTYTVGAGGASASNGGDTTFSTLTAGGGKAGGNGTGVTAVNTMTAGGAGGTSSGGDINVQPVSQAIGALCRLLLVLSVAMAVHLILELVLSVLYKLTMPLLMVMLLQQTAVVVDQVELKILLEISMAVRVAAD